MGQEKEENVEIRLWLQGQRGKLIEDIGKLVSCPSVSKEGDTDFPYGRGVAKAFKVAAGMAEEYGFSVWKNEHILRIKVKDPDTSDGKEIGIWGHLDVVEPGNGWDQDPWKMRVRDGFLIGRGVKDNKGPAIAVLYALRYIKEKKIPFPHGLSLYLGASEENGMKDIEAYKSLGGTIPDYSIVADGRWPVSFGEKGQISAELVFKSPVEGVERLETWEGDNAVCGFARASFYPLRISVPRIKGIRCYTEGEVQWIEAKGTARHAAFPEGSVNALGILFEAFSECPELSKNDREQFELLKNMALKHDGSSFGLERWEKDSGPLTCVVTSGRIEQDKRLHIKVNIRYPITVQEGEILRCLKENCEKLGIYVRILKSLQPASIEKEHPVIGILTESYGVVTGRIEEPFVLAGGTYAGKLPQAVAFGMGGWKEPGLEIVAGSGGGGAHGANEAVLIQNLIKGAEIYVTALKNLGKTRL